FKIRAYQKVARILDELPEDIVEIYKSQGFPGLEKIPGIGEGIAKKIVEFIDKGTFQKYEEVMQKVPPDLLALMGVPGIGPRTLKLIYDNFKVTTMDEFLKVLDDQRLLELPGMGEKKIENSILLLHTTIEELLPHPLKTQLRSVSINDLPPGFDYYALGHIHFSAILNKEGKIFAYPGPLFPSNFSELERQHEATFLIIEAKEGMIKEEDIRKISIGFGNVVNLEVNADNETPISLKEKISSELEKKARELKEATVTLKVYGLLKEGKTSEIDFLSIEEEAKAKGARCMLRNVSQLSSREFDIKIEDIESKDIEEIEQSTLKKALDEGLISEEDVKNFFSFTRIFNIDKIEGESSGTFETRIVRETVKALGIEELWA
ncbi:MAG: hypothetical protein K6T16_01675, partial [Candidatus Pacearchaeota archaeon]|nr:hypothetical protein [Candidatus Pacearchaeota archaeon]